MVVHTPTKLDALRQTAAERRAAGDVPPSVAAADATAAAAATTAGGAVATGDPLTPADEHREDLGQERAVEHDFDAWNGDNPPGTSSIDAQVHATIEDKEDDEVHDNVTTRRVKRGTGALTSGRADDQMPDLDKISYGESVSDVTPPPNTASSSSNYPQLNLFTPEWFTQMIGAAVSAAASAVANTPRPPSTPSRPDVPRRLNDRKVPDFWEDKPDFWFRIFDAHLAHFEPSEIKCFDALLPLLTPAARAVLHALIRAPGRNPYTKARAVLLRHFGRTPHQLAREFMETKSLGDKLPSELADHLQALVPDISSLYEVALLDSLPSNARDAALQQTGLAAMAAAADQVALGNRALAASNAAVNAVAYDVNSLDMSTPWTCRPLWTLPFKPWPLSLVLSRLA